MLEIIRALAVGNAIASALVFGVLKDTNTGLTLLAVALALHLFVNFWEN